MKKGLIAVALCGIPVLAATYYVGEVTQQQAYSLAEQLSQDPNVEIKIASYEKGFLSAKAVTEIVVTSPDVVDEYGQPLEMIVNSAISHLPYKAKAENYLEFVDSEISDKLTEFFGTKTPLSSKEEINLFGQLSGSATLVAGKFAEDGGEVKSEPVLINYQMDTRTFTGSSSLNWAGVKVDSPEGSAELSGIKMEGSFGKIKDTEIVTYDYLLALATAKIDSPQGLFDVSGVRIRSVFNQGATPQTVDSKVTLNVDSYQMEGPQPMTFSNTGLEISLNGLDQSGVARLSELSKSPDLMNETVWRDALNDIVSNGGQLAINRLGTDSPWGKIDAQATLDVAKGASAAMLEINPELVLPYVQGEASATLPKALLDAPVIGQQLNLAVMMGFLVVTDSMLEFKGSLKDAVLTVNDRTIPL